tara:strand:- start:108006 stop:108440 length:435 start_codon:yes stop_codon:yes gene_type:complete
MVSRRITENSVGNGLISIFICIQLFFYEFLGSDTFILFSNKGRSLPSIFTEDIIGILISFLFAIFIFRKATKENVSNLATKYICLSGAIGIQLLLLTLFFSFGLTIGELYGPESVRPFFSLLLNYIWIPLLCWFWVSLNHWIFR